MVEYLYICAPGHSGSTLLDLLLGSHSKIESLGEIAQLPKNIALNTDCSCGQPVLSCLLWSNVIQQVGNHLNINIPNNPYALNMGFPKAVAVVDKTHQTSAYLARRKILLGLWYLKLRFNLELGPRWMQPLYKSLAHITLVYDTVKQIQNAELIVDSSKLYLQAVGMYKNYPDRTRIILLTRDGRGVYYSYLKRGFSPKRSVQNWQNYYIRMLPLLDRHVNPKHIIHVRYEDLVQDTKKELTKICDQSGLEFEEEMLNFASYTHHITNGNNMRFATSSSIIIDNTWCDQLSEKKLEYFERKAGPLNRKLGYI